MRRKWLAVCAVFPILLSGGCQSLQASGSPSASAAAGPEQQAEYRSISAEEAEGMMVGEYILLDVRTEEEYRQERIDGAILIPDTEIAERAETELPDKGALILVYCRSGRRSELAAKELINQGYTNVYDFGGIIDWPYETIEN